MSRAFWVGIFIAGTLLILAGGVFLIGRTEFLFSSRYRLKTEFSNVVGLVQGAEVRVGGVRQGTVGNIALPKRPGDKVIVSVDLKNATRNIVKKDSTAAIKSEGLLGSKYVEVSFGSNDAEKLKDGDTIASEPPLDISDLIETSGADAFMQVPLFKQMFGVFHHLDWGCAELAGLYGHVGGMQVVGCANLF